MIHTNLDNIENQIENQIENIKDKSLLKYKNNKKYDDTKIIYFNGQTINVYGKNKNKIQLPKAFLHSLTLATQIMAKEDATFTKNIPKYWPKGRYSGKELSYKECEEIVLQEWRTSLTKSIIDFKLNPYNVPNRPYVYESKTGVLHIKK